MRYLVVFERAGDNYSAYVPDLPGCIATGDTREEVERNIKEAIDFHLAGILHDEGQLPPAQAFAEYEEVAAGDA